MGKPTILFAIFAIGCTLILCGIAAIGTGLPLIGFILFIYVAVMWTKAVHEEIRHHRAMRKLK